MTVINDFGILMSKPKLDKVNLKWFNHSDAQKYQPTAKSLDLARAVAMAQSKGVIAQDLTEALLLGHVDLQESFFWSVPGFVVEGLAILAALLTLTCLYLCCKVRNLSVAISVLAQSQAVLASPDELSGNEKDTTRNIKQLFQEAFASHVQWLNWLNMVFLVILGIIVILSWAWVKRIRHNKGAQLLLEIVTAEGGLYFTVRDLRGRMEDYTFNEDYTISSAKVMGRLCPILEVITDMSVRDRVFSSARVINKKIRLCPWHAGEVRRALAGPKYLFFVWRCDNVYTRIGGATRRDTVFSLTELTRPPPIYTPGMARTATAPAGLGSNTELPNIPTPHLIRKEMERRIAETRM